MPEENDGSPEGVCCECLGASDPEVCKAFFKAMLDAVMGPYAPAVDLVGGTFAMLKVPPEPPTEPSFPELIAAVPTDLPGIFGWSPDLPTVVLPDPVGVTIPGADPPGWNGEILGEFLVNTAMIPIQPVLDLVADPVGTLPTLELPTLEGLIAQIPLPSPPPDAPLPPNPNPACIAELLMFPVTMLQGAIDAGASEEEDDEEDSEE